MEGTAVASEVRHLDSLIAVRSGPWHIAAQSKRTGKGPSKNEVRMRCMSLYAWMRQNLWARRSGEDPEDPEKR